MCTETQRDVCAYRYVLLVIPNPEMLKLAHVERISVQEACVTERERAGGRERD